MCNFPLHMLLFCHAGYSEVKHQSGSLDPELWYGMVNKVHRKGDRFAEKPSNRVYDTAPM